MKIKHPHSFILKEDTMKAVLRHKTQWEEEHKLCAILLLQLRSKKQGKAQKIID